MKTSQYIPGSWMRESPSIVGDSTGTHYYLDTREVTRGEYESASAAQRESDTAARRERQFDLAEEAFAYASTLQDGIVLDWGRCYAGMEREGLKIGFAIEEDQQPIVAREDLSVQPELNHILVRRGRGQGIGACSTNFMDESKSWAEDECEVLVDGTGRYEKGQRLLVRVSPPLRCQKKRGA